MTSPLPAGWPRRIWLSSVLTLLVANAAQAAKPAPTPLAPSEPDAQSLVEPVKQEMQDKFGQMSKILADLREAVDRTGQDSRVNAKSIEDLKAKLEENSILVYEHLARGMERAQKIEDMAKRIGELEARLGVRSKPTDLAQPAAVGAKSQAKSVGAALQAEAVPK